MKTKPLRLIESELTISELLSYRLHRVANQISRSAALHYRREFNVSLGEWRTVALLGAHGTQSLNEVAKSAGLEKSQMSRVVTGLVERGLVLREIDSNDARGIRLTLTRTGQELYDGLIKAAADRNSRLQNCLNDQEHRALSTILRKLEKEARNLVDEERTVAREAVSRAAAQKSSKKAKGKKR